MAFRGSLCVLALFSCLLLVTSYRRRYEDSGAVERNEDESPYHLNPRGFRYQQRNTDKKEVIYEDDEYESDGGPSEYRTTKAVRTPRTKKPVVDVDMYEESAPTYHTDSYSPPSSSYDAAPKKVPDLTINIMAYQPTKKYRVLY